MSGYREAGNEERPQELEVAALRPRTRELITQAIAGSACLLSLRPPVLLPRAALALLFTLGLVLPLTALVPQFGSLTPPRVSTESRKIMLGAGLVSLAAAALFALDRARLRRGLPFDPGLYLLPLDLLDARSPRLVVRPLSTLREITDNRDRHGQGQATTLRLTFDDGALFTFPASHTDSTRLNADLSALRTSAELATAQKQTARLLSLDPFAEERPTWPARPDPLPPDRSRQPAWPLPILPFVLPPFLALLAPSLIEARDLASSRRCLAQATSDRDDEALRQIASQGGPLSEQADDVRYTIAQAEGMPGLLRYFREGGLHPSRVDDILFTNSMKADTLDALEDYLSQGRMHRDEVFTHLYERGERDNDVGALHVYERHHGPRQEDVVLGLLPRATLITTRPEELSPLILRQQIAFTRNSQLRATASQLLRQRFDTRLAKLGPTKAGAPLDARELLAIARAHDGLLQVAIENVPILPKLPLPRRTTSFAPLKERNEEQEITALFSRQLQPAIDAIEPGLMDVEVLNTNNPNFDSVPIRIRFETVPIEDPAIEAESFTMPLRLAITTRWGTENPVFVPLTTSLHFEGTPSDLPYLKYICQREGPGGQRCVYWRAARTWTLSSIEHLGDLNLLGLTAREFVVPPAPLSPPIHRSGHFPGFVR